MTKANGSSTDCAAFQELLPSLFESGEVSGHEHLQTCENCRTLVQDLEYIAEAGRVILLHLHDPSPAVWENIQTALKKESTPTE